MVSLGDTSFGSPVQRGAQEAGGGRTGRVGGHDSIEGNLRTDEEDKESDCSPADLRSNVVRRDVFRDVLARGL